MNELIAFLKNPKDERDIDQSKQKRLQVLGSLLAIDIPIMIAIATAVYGLTVAGWYSNNNHGVKSMIDSLPLSFLFLIAVILLPFFEELIFRFSLRFKRNYPLQIVLFLLPKTNTAIPLFWFSKFGYIFYLSAVIFAFAHISNFDFNEINIYFIPILVISQFIVGLFCGYLRVRYHFILGYLMHACHNGIFISIAIIGMDTNQQAIGY